MLKQLKSLFTKKQSARPPPISLKSDTYFPSVIAFAGNNSEELAGVACMMVESMLRPVRTIHPRHLSELGVMAIFGWKDANTVDFFLQVDGTLATTAIHNALEKLAPGIWLRSLDIVASTVAPGVLVLHSVTQAEADWATERGGIVIATESSPVTSIRRVPDFIALNEMPDAILEAIGEKRNG
jgi:hypothetical protein